MIQDMERSCRIASFWVSASMGALKYSVTFFLVDGAGTPRMSFGDSDKARPPYGEMPAVDGRYTARPMVAKRWEVQVRS